MRTSCSNCDVYDASIVKCPELCGRGASSFTLTLPSVHANISTVNRPTMPNPDVMYAARLRKYSMFAFSPSCGTLKVVSKIPLTCSFTNGGYACM